MKNAALFGFIAASAAVASAQVTVSNGTYTCALPNAVYCAGDSLKTDIIVRCDANGQGQAGRCSDNLDGEPPVGDYPALCYQTSSTSGDAACEKNCVVYGNGTFTLPADECKPTYTASSDSASSTLVKTTPHSTKVSTEVSKTTIILTSTVTVCPESSPIKHTTSVAKSSPAKISSEETSPAKTTHVKTTPVKSTPAKSTPGKSTPAKTTPAKTTPAKSSPTTVHTAGAAALGFNGVLGAAGLLAAYVL